MFAIILAGGAGTRLRPLTYARRKELVPVVNRPLLEYRLRGLKEHGIEDVVLACSQGMREVEEHFGDGASLGLRIRYNYEDRPLGSGRAVKEAARAHGATGTLVVCNGDIITNVDLTAMIARHRETGATLSMSLAPVHDPWDYGVAEVDAELCIHSFVEKPPQGTAPSNLHITGRYILQPAIFDLLEHQERGAGGEIQLTDAMIKMHARAPQSFHAVRFDGAIFDCGNSRGFLMANVAYALARDDIGPGLRDGLKKLL